MLRISIPSNGPAQLTFSTFENFNLPKPVNGIDSEVNNVLLLFDDEQDAIDYNDRLIEYLNDLDNVSPKRAAINEIIMAIKSDEFVQTYLQ